MNHNHVPHTLLIALLAALLPTAAIDAAAATHMPTEESQPVWDCTGRTPRVKHAQYDDIRYLAEIAPPAQTVPYAEPYESPLLTLAQKTDDTKVKTYLNNELRPWDADVQLEQTEQISLLTTPAETTAFNESRHHPSRLGQPFTWLEKESDDNRMLRLQGKPYDYRKIYAFLRNKRFAQALEHKSRFLTSLISSLCNDLAFELSTCSGWDGLHLTANQDLIEELLARGMGTQLDAQEQRRYAAGCEMLDFIHKRNQTSGVTHPNPLIRLRSISQNSQATRQLQAVLDGENIEQLTELLSNNSFTDRLTALQITYLYHIIIIRHPRLIPCLLASPFFAELPGRIGEKTLLKIALRNDCPEAVQAILNHPQFPDAALTDTPSLCRDSLFSLPLDDPRTTRCFLELIASRRITFSRTDKNGNNVLHILMQEQPEGAHEAAIRILTLPSERFPSRMVNEPNSKGISNLGALVLAGRYYPAATIDDPLVLHAAALLGMRRVTLEDQRENPDLEGREWVADWAANEAAREEADPAPDAQHHADPNAGLTQHICSLHGMCNYSVDDCPGCAHKTKTDLHFP